MGDKIESKKLARAAGVSTVPGFLGEVEHDEEAEEEDEEFLSSTSSSRQQRLTMESGCQRGAQAGVS